MQPLTTKANVFQTQDTQLAAALVALGFPWSHHVRHRVGTGHDYIDFEFGVRSARPQFAHFSITIAKVWKKGALPPMHPLAVMMRVLANRSAIMDMLRGSPMRLVSVADGCMTEFRPGAELSTLLVRPRELIESDLDLVAALAGLGIPPIAITGTHPSHLFHLPRYGYTLKDPVTKAPILYDAAHLLRRAPTAVDPLRLALEGEDPLHPLVLGYDVLTVRSELLRIIRSTQPVLVVEDSGLIAQLSLNYTGRVMQHVSARLGTVQLS